MSWPLGHGIPVGLSGKPFLGKTTTRLGPKEGIVYTDAGLSAVENLLFSERIG